MRTHLTAAPGLVVLALLAACGTPQEQCIRNETRELATLDRLIREAEANLARGYAYETVEITRTEWQICEYIPDPNDPTKPPRPRYCLEDVTDTVQKTVAIDPAAEERKLASLKAKRRKLEPEARAAIAECRATYPE
jgi:hypothetical protein